MTELVEELAETLTLSAYISTEYARLRGGTHAVWQTEVADFVTALRTRYANAVAKSEHGLLERNLRRLELRLRGLPHAVRASGWLVIVARGDVHYCAPLPSRGSSEGRWQYGPWLAPELRRPLHRIRDASRRTEHGAQARKHRSIRT